MDKSLSGGCKDRRVSPPVDLAWSLECNHERVGRRFVDLGPGELLVRCIVTAHTFCRHTYDRTVPCKEASLSIQSESHAA